MLSVYCKPIHDLYSINKMHTTTLILETSVNVNNNRVEEETFTEIVHLLRFRNILMFIYPNY